LQQTAAFIGYSTRRSEMARFESRVLTTIVGALLLAGTLAQAVDRSPTEWPIGWSWLPGEARDGMRLLACRYADTKLVASGEFRDGVYESDDARWSVALERDGVDYSATFRLEEGAVDEAGVAIAFDFSNWSTNNYVLAPAALYNGNRFRALNYSYPPYIYDEEYRGADIPISTTDVPRLSTDGSHAKVELLTGNCSTPMLAFHDAAAGRGWILITEQNTRFGDSGMFIEEDPASGRAAFVISAPGVRERRSRGGARAASIFDALRNPRDAPAAGTRCAHHGHAGQGAGRHGSVLWDVSARHPDRRQLRAVFAEPAYRNGAAQRRGRFVRTAQDDVAERPRT
jgi:hypothetical protein